MAILVTGACGMIGSHVVDYLAEHGNAVIGLDDLSGGFKENLHPAAAFCQGSITDTVLIEHLFKNHKIEYVYHLAAYAAEGLSHFIRNFNYTNNLLGSVNLINAAVRHNCKAFIFSSSNAVYGDRTGATEETLPTPEDPYGISKYAVELDLKAAHEMFGLPYVIFRPANVFGPKQNTADGYRNVVGIFMNQVLQNKQCTIFGDGTQTRAFTCIDDVAPVIARSAFMPEAHNQIFNIGSNNPYSVFYLARKVQEAMGSFPGVHFLPARKEALHTYADHSKANQLFGKSETPLVEGLRRMADWIKTIGPRQPKKFENIEITKNLPESWKNLG